MDQNDKDKLDKALEYAKENNKLIRRIRNSMRLSTLLSFIYWLIVLVGVAWLYQFIDPYISQLIEVYSSVIPSK